MKGLLKIKNLHASIDGKEILKGIDLDSLALEEIIKQALKKMMKG